MATASRPRPRRPPTRRARPRARGREAGADASGRERILAVATRAFSELGYEGTTTAQVARDAGVTQPLVHHHFGSKEGLWRAAMDRLFAGAVALASAPADLPPAERLLATTERFVRFVAEHPEATRVIAREGATPSPRLRWLVDHYLRDAFGAVVEATRAAQREGTIAADVPADILLFLMLGAGSHLFDVTALAQLSVGLDATSPATRDAAARLLRELFVRSVLRTARDR
jgi:AcrR family transcriptional regulator